MAENKKANEGGLKLRLPRWLIQKQGHSSLRVSSKAKWLSLSDNPSYVSEKLCNLT